MLVQEEKGTWRGSFATSLPRGELGGGSGRGTEGPAFGRSVG